MFSFLWNDKPDKIKRIQITQDYENGGLKMVDISKFSNCLKASWVKRIMYQNNPN